MLRQTRDSVQDIWGPRAPYRIGVPEPGRYVQVLNSDDPKYHGSGFATHAERVAEPVPMHGRTESIELSLPPLSVLVLEWKGGVGV